MATNASRISSERRRCPQCGEERDEGETLCPRCGVRLPPSDRTRDLSSTIEPVEPTPLPSGSPVRSTGRPLRLQIDGLKVPLPLHDNITLGRPISQSDPWQTHIDLTPFDAHERGVSRRHLRIITRDQLTYVSDLSSTNGTWLNGQRLTPFNEYLLHDGDELRLGLLKMKIRF